MILDGWLLLVRSGATLPVSSWGVGQCLIDFGKIESHEKHKKSRKGVTEPKKAVAKATATVVPNNSYALEA